MVMSLKLTSQKANLKNSEEKIEINEMLRDEIKKNKKNSKQKKQH